MIGAAAGGVRPPEAPRAVPVTALLALPRRSLLLALHTAGLLLRLHPLFLRHAWIRIGSSQQQSVHVITSERKSQGERAELLFLWFVWGGAVGKADRWREGLVRHERAWAWLDAFVCGERCTIVAFGRQQQ